MADIKLRTGLSGKGSPLTLEEVDANFTNLNIEVGQKLDSVNYTATDVYTKVKSVNSTDTVGLNATTLTGIVPSYIVPSATDKTSVVTRNSSGNIQGTTVTASTQFTGNVVGNVTGALSGNADTATKLITARTINTVPFDGTASIVITDNTKLPLVGGTLSGFLTLHAAPTEDMHAANKQYVDTYGCPKGAIIMWSGNTLPAGWGLCDGTVQSGTQTPDLRNKFILGSTTLSQNGDTGGSNTVTTSSAPSHTHSSVTGATALGINDYPAHTHDFYDVYAIQDERTNGNYNIVNGVPTYTGAYGTGIYNILNDADGNQVKWSYYLSGELCDDNDYAAFAFKNRTLSAGGDGDLSYTVNNAIWDFTSAGNYSLGTDTRVDLYTTLTGISTPPVSPYIGSFGFSTATNTANAAASYIRTLTSTVKYVLKNINKLTYLVNKGTTADWGETPDTTYANQDERLELQFSVDGTTWYTMDHTKPSEVTANKWVEKRFTIPSGAQIDAGVYLRYYQKRGGVGSTPRDTWGFSAVSGTSTVAVPSGGHTHSIGADGVHTHTVSGILPPYYKLAYIIKLI
jgi:hypothetical protein